LYQVIGKDKLVEAADTIFETQRSVGLQLKGTDQWLTDAECRKCLL
jgi:hypothetical protein